MRAVIGMAILVALAGCGKARETPLANDAAGFVPPAVQPPTPLPGQAQSTPLTVYVGKYPGDPVDGVGFYDRTSVANALIAAVPQEKLRHLIAGREATSTPIFAKDGRIGAHGCEPHNCSDNDWTFLVRADGTGGTACHHEASDGANSRWYSGDKPVIRPGDCPAS